MSRSRNRIHLYIIQDTNLNDIRCCKIIFKPFAHLFIASHSSYKKFKVFKLNNWLLCASAIREVRNYSSKAFIVATFPLGYISVKLLPNK